MKTMSNGSVLIALCIVLMFLAFGIGTAAAEERTSKPLMLSGGLICDTTEQVIDAINVKLQQHTEGCGMLRGQQIGTVTRLGTYEADGLTYQLARYDFISPVPWGNQVQYGYIGKPTPTQASLNQDI